MPEPFRWPNTVRNIVASIFAIVAGIYLHATPGSTIACGIAALVFGYYGFGSLYLHLKRGKP